ncbi:MAG TPA: sensor histidine kinase [Solirubrobacteraceae bacterium]|nr:sensor histidine kinase [Solirubrobacteraceae bacterium]
MTRRQLIDGGVPLLLAAVAMGEVLTSDTIDAPWPAVGLFALGTTVPLMWRRQAPLLVLVIVLASLAIADVGYGIANDVSSSFAGILVAAYAAGAYTTRRDGRIAAGIMGAVVLLMAAAIGEDFVGDAIFIGGILFAVWGAATVVRSRQELATALAARTVELEHEREENARLAVAEERARIARELHDVVAHKLSIMVVQAGAERRALRDQRPETSEVLATIEESGRSAMAEMRRLLGMLRRSDDELALAPQPSLSRLGDLVDEVRAAGMPVDLRIEGEPRQVAPGVDLSAYRIVQEALTNALKHAGPARARVTVRYGDTELDIEIADDGAGATEPAPAGGHGLVGMRERVALFGGDLAAGRRRGGGYAVRARLPLAGGAP